MVTSEQIDKFSDKERDAWMALLSDDENVILHAPSGFRTLTAISEVKWFLEQEIPDDARLRFLEFLERQDDLFSVEAIAG